MKTCPLRKPCVICKKEFGRRLQALKPNETVRHFEAKSSFSKRLTCGQVCGWILVAWGAHMKSQEALLQQKNSGKLSHQYNNFIYQPIAGNIRA